MELIDTTIKNIQEFGICGYKNEKREGYREKIGWVERQAEFGLTIKTLFSEDSGTQGMIEYIPGEYCWRPVEASNYLFIHCLFVGHKKEYKNNGYGSMLIESCLDDAKKQGKAGVAVVTRKGSFMVKDEIFIKNGFEVVDNEKPDFQLLVKTIKSDSAKPVFKKNRVDDFPEYLKGLTILRADQCPYTVKNVNEIIESAKEKYKITPRLINIANHKDAQRNPCPFGTFGIIYEGEIVSYHPISKKRFCNIMDKIESNRR